MVSNVVSASGRKWLLRGRIAWLLGGVSLHGIRFLSEQSGYALNFPGSAYAPCASRHTVFGTSRREQVGRLPLRAAVVVTASQAKERGPPSPRGLLRAHTGT